MAKRLILILLMAVLALAACDGQGKPAALLVAADNQTWFDAPLEGDSLPLAPYEIVLHAFIKGGVSQVELNANGELLANLPNPGSTGNLATFKYMWTPAGYGNYALTARAEGAGGWGAYTTVNVTVADFTPTPTITMTPTITSTPTITPTITLTPTISPTITQTQLAQLTYSRQVSTSLFYNGSCSPNSITVNAQVSDPGRVSGMILFQSLEGVSGWDGGTNMSPQGGGSFSVTIYGTSVPGNNDTRSATWLHQLVATGAGGAVEGRSGVYNDVTYNICKPVVEQPQQPLQPIQPIQPGIIVPPLFRIKSPTPTPYTIY